MRIPLLLLTIVTIASSAIAQPIDPSVCNAALASIRDRYDLLSSREQFETYQQRLRDARFETYDSFRSTGASLGIDIPLAEGLLGLSGSYSDRAGQFSQKYQDFLRASYSNTQVRQRFESRTEKVNDELARQWTRCYSILADVILRTNGTVITAAPVGGFDNFIVEVRSNTHETQPVVVKAIEPGTLVRCTRAGAEVTPGTTITSRSFSLTCAKDPTRSLAMTVETNAGVSQRVNLPAQTSRLDEMQNRINDLQAQVRELSDRLNQVQSASVQYGDKISLLAVAAGYYVGVTPGMTPVNTGIEVQKQRQQPLTHEAFVIEKNKY